MLSRVAESIYWMSRQVERAENLARFLEVTHHLILDQPDTLVDPWAPLIQVTADNELFAERYGVMNAENVTQFLAFDTTYGNSMLSSLRQARGNARGVRESISSEAFEQLNEFYRFVSTSAQSPAVRDPQVFFDSVRRHAIQWTGVIDSTMPRGIAWHFANVGRLLERADKSLRILDVKYFNILPRVEDVGTAVDDLQWSALLSAISGFEAYRHKHHLIRIEKVIEFFLFNPTFPRSVLYCVLWLRDSLQQIETVSKQDSESAALPLADRLCEHLLATQVEQVLEIGMHQFIDDMQTELNEIGKAMNLDFFQVETH